MEPSNKQCLKYLQLTEGVLSKKKTEAYSKLTYFADIMGETTTPGNHVIDVEEFNLNAEPSTSPDSSKDGDTQEEIQQ